MSISSNFHFFPPNLNYSYCTSAYRQHISVLLLNRIDILRPFHFISFILFYFIFFSLPSLFFSCHYVLLSFLISPMLLRLSQFIIWFLRIFLIHFMRSPTHPSLLSSSYFALFPPPPHLIFSHIISCDLFPPPPHLISSDLISSDLLSHQIIRSLFSPISSHLFFSLLFFSSNLSSSFFFSSYFFSSHLFSSYLI